jgi:AmiR/NasT family two-component response regulator
MGGAVQMNDRYRHSDRVNAATGMVSVQASCTCAEAIVLMNQRAIETQHKLDEIALSVLDREIRFSG